jgi:hypothetical protein
MEGNKFVFAYIENAMPNGVSLIHVFPFQEKIWLLIEYFSFILGSSGKFMSAISIS